jgi:hypothetical protein
MAVRPEAELFQLSTVDEPVTYLGPFARVVLPELSLKLFRMINIAQCGFGRTV